MNVKKIAKNHPELAKGMLDIEKRHTGALQAYKTLDMEYLDRAENLEHPNADAHKFAEKLDELLEVNRAQQEPYARQMIACTRTMRQLHEYQSRPNNGLKKTIDLCANELEGREPYEMVMYRKRVESTENCTKLDEQIRQVMEL